MGEKNWYRRTTWTEEDQGEFFRRLKRARTVYNKAQYLFIQARCLVTDTKPPNYEAALALLDQLVNNFRDPAHLASAYLQKAKILEVLGRLEMAVDAYREAVEAEQAPTAMNTTAALDYSLFVVTYKMKHLYQEALEAYGKIRNPEVILVLPIMQYKAFAVMALMGEADGRFQQAREYARKALQAWNGHRSGEVDLEGVVFEEPPEEIYTRLSRLANLPKPFWKFWS